MAESWQKWLNFGLSLAEVWLTQPNAAIFSQITNITAKLRHSQPFSDILSEIAVWLKMAELG